MTPIRRLFLAAVLALAILAAPGATAPARAQGDTSAVAVNTKDGSSLFKFAFQVRRTMHHVVDSTNAPVAYASCTDCRTVAVSFQVLLVTSDASTQTPTNLALAINESCTECDTAAFAYQFVMDEGGPVHFTADGNRRLAELRNRLRQLETTTLTDDELHTILDEAANELRDILANEVVAVGRPPDAAAIPDSGATPTPSAEPAQSGEPPPGATPEPGPTATPTATATATPTASPTATATP